MTERPLGSGLRIAVAAVIHRWKHPTYRLGTPGCRCYEDARTAVEITGTGADGFVFCPLCGDPERAEDIVGGVCLSCADAIAFAQNARRGAIEVQS